MSLTIYFLLKKSSKEHIMFNSKEDCSREENRIWTCLRFNFFAHTPKLFRFTAHICYHFHEGHNVGAYPRVWTSLFHISWKYAKTFLFSFHAFSFFCAAVHWINISIVQALAPPLSHHPVHSIQANHDDHHHNDNWKFNLVSPKLDFRGKISNWISKWNKHWAKVVSEMQLYKVWNWVAPPEGAQSILARGLESNRLKMQI